MAHYRKTYMTRANEARIPIRLGDIMVDAHFVNGNLRDNENATLDTEDTLVQFVIENSPMFGQRIFLKNQILIEEPVEEPELTADNVTSLADARAFLEKEYSVNPKTVISPNALKAQIAKLGLSFPNLQL